MLTYARKLKNFNFLGASDARRVNSPCLYTGGSTETVAFQVYEILKIDHEFLQFFLTGIKNISV